MDKQHLIEVRAEYCNLIRRELLGPGSEISIPDAEHEFITSKPYQRYSLGVLYPQGANMEDAEKQASESGPDDVDDTQAGINEQTGQETETDQEETRFSQNLHAVQDADSTDADEDTLDDEVELSAQMLPSSFGMSFLVTGNPRAIRFQVECGVYRQAAPGEHKYPVPDGFDGQTLAHNGLDDVLTYDKTSGCLVPNPAIECAQLEDCLEKKRCALYEDLNKGNDELRTLKGANSQQQEAVGDGRTKQLEDKMRELAWQVDVLRKMSKPGFVRIPLKGTYSITFDEGHNSAKTEESLNWGTSDSIRIAFCALRRNVGGDKTTITIMMVNQEEGRPSDSNCIYQPIITISSVDNDGMTFLPLQATTDFSTLDDEEKALEVQYRDKRTYASGLGVSVTWNIDSKGQGVLRTEFMPEEEVPGMDFTIPQGTGIEEQALSMLYLSDMDATPWQQKAEHLKTVCNAYRNWVDSLRQIKLDDKYSETAKKLVARCQESLERMEGGLQVLNENSNAQLAFLLANRAMYMQRFHIKLQERLSDKWRFNGDAELSELLEELEASGYQGQFKNANLQAVANEKSHWRLFQLAFLLVSVAGIVDDQSQERGLVDLIWFPTGGGKTEAYLGLTAFTIFYRRLAHPDASDGTTVIMRYTLRLLTAQQFTRAATLICACEQIRKSQKGFELGKTPISIGLWIGSAHTPNTNASAQQCYAQLKQVDVWNLAHRKAENYKFQMLKCPWCGTQLTKEIQNERIVGDWGVALDRGRVSFRCPQETCAFHRQLPIQVVDEELYKHPPTLLFATVDKFAMLAWKEATRAFFAMNDDNENRGPELIIQDELHLISGALGTMVAMYETVIDELCSAKGVPPKIVASTATIRRAASQCGLLYNRDVRQFPSPGIDADDSFFARVSKLGDGHHGRLYIGVMPSGKSKATMQVRAIASLMQKIKDMPLDDAVRDRYWTLTGYFNSLKDLGKCSTLVRDDVKDVIRNITRRLSSGRELFSQIRLYTEPCELTSRVTTTDLNKTLDRLEKNRFHSDRSPNGGRPVDIVLATNMISVGIDVARLNVMFMVGQPKLTSEYIQASSRVGRSDPGVIFVLYDASKSRDRSHYEQFRRFHESFYRDVEPTGVTPFSRPAIDRCLHAVLVALLRAEEPACATSPAPFPPSDSVCACVNSILERMESVLRKSNPEGEEEIEHILDGEVAYARDIINAFLEKWRGRCTRIPPNQFSYGEKYLRNPPSAGETRLLKPFGKVARDDAFDTLTSLRNVDGSVAGSLIVEL